MSFVDAPFRPRPLMVSVLLSIVTLCSCRPDSVTQKIEKEKKSLVSATTEPERTAGQKTLESAMEQLQPENIYINSDPADVVNLLNSWIQSAGALVSVDTSTLPADFLTPIERARLDTQQFDYADAAYLARCFLARGIVRAHCPEELSDLERVVRLFEFTMRNISLPVEGQPVVPTLVEESLSFGWGIHQSRVLVFASLVGQLGFSTVVISPKDVAGNYLVGVVLDGEVYLFEPRYGIPVPAGGKSETNGRIMPATLKQVLANSKSLDSLSPRSDIPYPITPDQLRDSRVMVCAESEEWLPRMEILEKSVLGGRTIRFYNRLNDEGDQPGLLKRVCSGHSDWKPADLQVWPYPLLLIKNRSILEDPNDQGHVGERNLMSLTYMALQAPFERGTKAISYSVTFDPVKGEVVRKPSESEESDSERHLVPRNLRRLHRVMQMTGRCEDAIRSGISLRRMGSDEVKPPPGKEIAYKLAAEDILMVTAIAKYELGQFDGAIDSVETYGRIYPRGRWRSLLRWTMAHAEYRQGNIEKAIGLLASTDFSEPNSSGVAVLLSLWKAQTEAEKKTDPSDKKRDEKSSDETKEDAGKKSTDGPDKSTPKEGESPKSDAA